MLIRIEKDVDTSQAPYVGDEAFWESLPSYTVPMSLPHGVSVAVNVRGPIDLVTGKERFVRFVRVYDVDTDTFTDRVDCEVDLLHDCFKTAPSVELVTSEDDSTIVKNPDYLDTDVEVTKEDIDGK